MKKLVTCFMILTSASFSAKAANYCGWQEGGMTIWHAMNEALGVIPGIKNGQKAAVALSKILQRNLQNATGELCAKDFSIKEVLDMARLVATEEIDAALAQRLTDEINIILKRSAIDLDFNLADRLMALKRIESDAANLNEKAIPVTLLASTIKLTIINEIVNNSFEYDSETTDSWGRWFSAMTDAIEESERSQELLDKAILAYSDHLKKYTKLESRIEYFSDLSGSSTAWKIVSASLTDASGASITSKVEVGRYPCERPGALLCFEIWPWKAEEFTNEYISSYVKEAKKKNNFNSIYASLGNAKTQASNVLNRRNVLYKTSVWHRNGSITGKNDHAKRTVDGILGDGTSKNSYVTDGGSDTGPKNVKLLVRDLQLEKECSLSDTRQNRFGIVGVGLRVHASKSKIYTLSMFDDKGKLIGNAKNINVYPDKKHYYVNWTGVPYKSTMNFAPMAEYILIETKDAKLELDEVYAFSPDIAMGMTASFAGGRLKSSDVINIDYSGSYAKNALDGYYSEDYQIYLNYPELRLPGMHPDDLYTDAASIGGEWVGILPKPTRLSKIRIQFSKGNALSNPAPKFYNIKLFNQYGNLVHSLFNQLPDRNNLYNSAVCGSAFAADKVKKIVVRPVDGGDIAIQEFKAKALEFVE